ncbi:hypothetical protein D9758_014224 [Tetrapyrgos nigripes]|uniref:Uncharacterized protein n=1 Tax=Tetrapyrgos nigripes TaxID=182062 RepID=A0A8H5FTX7_9AGAR|nr:hypothetical protein D9758_014224 [Tetrapyrgos nigripes]
MSQATPLNANAPSPIVASIVKVQWFDTSLREPKGLLKNERGVFETPMPQLDDLMREQVEGTGDSVTAEDFAKCPECHRQFGYAIICCPYHGFRLQKVNIKAGWTSFVRIPADFLHRAVRAWYNHNQFHLTLVKYERNLPFPSNLPTPPVHASGLPFSTAFPSPDV